MFEKVNHALQAGTIINAEFCLFSETWMTASLLPKPLLPHKVCSFVNLQVNNFQKISFCSLFQQKYGQKFCMTLCSALLKNLSIFFIDMVGKGTFLKMQVFFSTSSRAEKEPSTVCLILLCISFGYVLQIVLGNIQAQSLNP